MKAILEFNLDEEKQAFHEAMNGGKYSMILGDLKQDIRTILKYGTEDDLETVLERLRSLIPTDEELYV